MPSVGARRQLLARDVRPPCGPADGRRAALEVVAAADANAIALWTLVNGVERLTYPSLRGGWTAQLALGTRAKRLLADLPQLLTALERSGTTSLARGMPEYAYARSLGLVSLRQSRTEFPGSVYFLLDLPSERSGGWVADHGNALPAWVSEWLGSPGQADVLAKLASADVDKRHAFVFVPVLSTAPFGVADLLMRENSPLPTDAPALPPPVSHVWAVSMWSSGCGFRWSAGRGWDRFDKLQRARQRSA